MADDAKGQPSNTVKDPDDWTTGDETMTGAQASYLKTLCDEAGEEFEPTLSKAQASKRIDELQQRTGRGKNH
jgi:hypothetical protein